MSCDYDKYWQFNWNCDCNSCQNEQNRRRKMNTVMNVDNFGASAFLSEREFKALTTQMAGRLDEEDRQFADAVFTQTDTDLGEPAVEESPLPN